MIAKMMIVTAIVTMAVASAFGQAAKVQIKYQNAIQQGSIYLENGNVSAAVKSYNDAIKLMPKEKDAYKVLISLYEETKMILKATGVVMLAKQNGCELEDWYIEAFKRKLLTYVAFWPLTSDNVKEVISIETDPRTKARMEAEYRDGIRIYNESAKSIDILNGKVDEVSSAVSRNKKADERELEPLKDREYEKVESNEYSTTDDEGKILQMFKNMMNSGVSTPAISKGETAVLDFPAKGSILVKFRNEVTSIGQVLAIHINAASAERGTATIKCKIMSKALNGDEPGKNLRCDVTLCFAGGKIHGFKINGAIATDEGVRYIRNRVFVADPLLHCK